MKNTQENLRKKLLEDFSEYHEIDHLIYMSKNTNTIMVDISYNSTEFAKEISISTKRIQKQIDKLENVLVEISHE